MCENPLARSLGQILVERVIARQVVQGGGLRLLQNCPALENGLDA